MVEVWDSNYRFARLVCLPGGGMASLAFRNAPPGVWFKWSPDGSDWSRDPVQVYDSALICDLAADPKTGVLYVVAYNAAMKKSKDNGRTWSNA